MPFKQCKNLNDHSKFEHMDELKDIRWQQRFENYERSFKLLESAVNKGTDTILERAGLIQFFEMSFELAWKVLKDYLEANGTEVKSPREAIKTAFQQGLIENGHDWIDALTDRNLTVHTYDEATALLIEGKITGIYFPLLKELYSTFNRKI